MTPTIKYFLYGFILLTLILALIIVGFFGFFEFSGKPWLPFNAERLTNEETLTNEEALNREFEQAQKEADYLAAAVSFGPLVQTQEISVEYDNEKDSADGFLTLQEAKAVKARQDVILYDEDGNTLPLGGHVETIKTIDEFTVKVTISLPNETNTQYLLKQPEIIILETTASKRLPLSALQQDKTGGEYIWTARPQENKTTYKITRRYIEKRLFDKDYFEIGREIGVYDLVLLNPNQKTRSDKSYNILVTELNAPLHNPIRQAWIDYDLYRLEKQQEQMIQAAENCRKGINADGSPVVSKGSCGGGGGETTGNSCGGSASTSCGGGTADPLAIFNSLLEINKNDSSSSSGSGACGNSSNSCGQ